MSRKLVNQKLSRALKGMLQFKPINIRFSQLHAFLLTERGRFFEKPLGFQEVLSLRNILVYILLTV